MQTWDKFVSLRTAPSIDKHNLLVWIQFSYLLSRSCLGCIRETSFAIRYDNSNSFIVPRLNPRLVRRGLADYSIMPISPPTLFPPLWALQTQFTCINRLESKRVSSVCFYDITLPPFKPALSRGFRLSVYVCVMCTYFEAVHCFFSQCGHSKHYPKIYTTMKTKHVPQNLTYDKIFLIRCSKAVFGTWGKHLLGLSSHVIYVCKTLSHRFLIVVQWIK